MEKPLIAITIRSFDPTGTLLKTIIEEFEIIYLNSTGSRLSEDDLISAVQNADFVIAGTERFSKKVLDSAKNLKAISRVGVGTDSIDLTEAESRKVRILTTPEAPVIAVAEHALALLLSVMKRIPQYNTNIRQGDHSIISGSLLAGKTVGIVGMGRIGQRFSSILICMGCKIRYVDPFLKFPPNAEWEPVPTLGKLVETSDIISLHASPRVDGLPLINSAVLRHCKKGTILINTARGILIDETALEQAVKDGIIVAAGLDVFIKEPYMGSLLKYSQIIVTPHIASNTNESREQMEREAVDNLIHAKRSIFA